MIQLHEVRYGRYAIRGHPYSPLLTVGNINMTDAQSCEAGTVLVHFNLRARKLSVVPEKCAAVQVIFV
jgi:hypothetical protein